MEQVAFNFFADEQYAEVRGIKYIRLDEFHVDSRGERRRFCKVQCPDCFCWRKVQGKTLSAIARGEISGRCARCTGKYKAGHKAGKWNGGRSVIRGYWRISAWHLTDSERQILSENIKNAKRENGYVRSGYIEEHHAMSGLELGRALNTKEGEQIHHGNGIKTENFKSNRCLCKNSREHQAKEQKMFPRVQSELERAYRALDEAGIEFRKKALDLMPMQYQLEQGRITPEEVEESLIFQRRAEDPNWRDNPKLNKILA